MPTFRWLLIGASDRLALRLRMHSGQEVGACSNGSTAIRRYDVFHLSPNAYLVLTPDLIVADANRVFCTLTDRRREQIIGRSLVDVYPQEATPAARAAQASIRRSMRAAIERRVSDVMPRVQLSILEGPKPDRVGPPQRRARFWRFDHIPLLRPDGTVYALLQHAIDLTAQVQTETALRHSEAQFRVVTEAMPVMVWSTTAEGQADYHNQQWSRFTGQSAQASTGHDWMQVVHPDDRPRMAATWTRAVASGSMYETEYRLRSAAGPFRWVVDRGMPMHDAVTHELVRWFGTITDIDDLVAARDALARDHATMETLVAARTAELAAANQQLRIEAEEREIAEARLRDAQRLEAIGQLTGGIAQDFNNLLTLVLGGLETIASQSRLLPRRNETERIIRACDLASRGAERAARLTEQLLAFARRQLLDAQPLDCNALVAGMVDGLADTLGHATRLSQRLTPQLWTTQVDRRQLEQALLHLVLNAGEALPDGGHVCIETANRTVAEPAVAGGVHGCDGDGLAAGDYVVLSVADNGRGMDAETQARAFEPFFTTKTAGQGFGLGLSQVYGFVRQSNGQVRIETGPGGTCVRLFLPRVTP